MGKLSECKKKQTMLHGEVDCETLGYVSMCEREHAPFEKPLHDIYEKELCISPIPSLALHFTNVNSIFGLSPNVNWKEVWDQNGN